jgi:hypothetical protein
MRPEAIVFPPPALDKDLRFRQRVKHVAIEKLIPELPDMGLNVAVIPGASGLDIEGGYARSFSQLLTALAVNSEPLSDRRYPGTPRVRNSP